MKLTAMERFWAKTKPAADGSGCILWTACKLPKGYGRFGDNYKCVLSHRWIYEQTHGVNLGRLDFVLHSCDTPSCVNVKHLRVGTGKENTADMDARGRRVARGAIGVANTKAKLTDEIVLQLRARHARGGVTYQQLADEYGMSDAGMHAAISGKNWRHLNDRSAA